MEIKVTKNYENFKFKKENRELNHNKILSLKAKLLEDGRQILPIICNKNMEIIDGQHRFQALKELEWNIMYYIDETITGKDLISINNTQKNWGLLDFIHYYSILGNETYCKIEELCKKYSDIPLKPILTSLGKKYVKEYIIKEGSLNFTDEEFAEAEIALEFIKQIKDSIKLRITNLATFTFLLLKTYYLEGIDKERLFNNVISKYGTENYGTALQCAMAIEHWYNYKARTYRYISNEIIPQRKK